MTNQFVSSWRATTAFNANLFISVPDDDGVSELHSMQDQVKKTGMYEGNMSRIRWTEHGALRGAHRPLRQSAEVRLALADRHQLFHSCFTTTGSFISCLATSWLVMSYRCAAIINWHFSPSRCVQTERKGDFRHSVTAHTFYTHASVVYSADTLMPALFAAAASTTTPPSFFCAKF